MERERHIRVTCNFAQSKLSRRGGHIYSNIVPIPFRDNGEEAVDLKSGCIPECRLCLFLISVDIYYLVWAALAG